MAYYRRKYKIKTIIHKTGNQEPGIVGSGESSGRQSDGSGDLCVVRLELRFDLVRETALDSVELKWADN